MKYKFKISIYLVLIKALYILTCSEMLSDDWHGFSFGVSVDFSRIWIEILPFIIGMRIYLNSYKCNAVSFFCTMVFVMAFIPANSGLTISNNNLFYYTLNQIYLLFILLLSGKLSLAIGDKYGSEGALNTIYNHTSYKMIFRLSMVLLTSLIILKVYLQNGLDFTNIILGEMYDVRSENTEFYASHEGSFFAYFYIFADAAMYWIVPIFLYNSIIRKNLVDMSVAIIAVLAEFSTSMTKGTLFVLFIVVYFAMLNIYKRENKASEFFLLGIITLFGISHIEFIYNEFSVVFESVIRRTFYMTQYMISCHYDFFSTHDKFWFTHECFLIERIMQPLLGSSYHTGAIKIISDNCFDGLIPAPNAGMFAEAYAQMGVLGTIVFPFIHVYLLKIVYTYSSWYGTGICMVLSAKFFLRLNSVYNLETGYLFALIFFIVVTIWLQKETKTSIDNNKKKRKKTYESSSFHSYVSAESK